MSLLVVFDTTHQNKDILQSYSRGSPKCLGKIHLDSKAKQRLLLYEGGGQGRNQTQAFTYLLKAFNRTEVQSCGNPLSASEILMQHSEAWAHTLNQKARPFSVGLV